jgi:hypothetical protein
MPLNISSINIHRTKTISFSDDCGGKNLETKWLHISVVGEDGGHPSDGVTLFYSENFKREDAEHAMIDYLEQSGYVIAKKEPEHAEVQ